MDPARVVEDRNSITLFYELHPLLFKGTRRTVSLAVWLYDTERIFRTSHIVAHLQVSLASRCLVVDAHLWWLTLGERAMPDRSWAHFRMLVIARFGPVPDEGANTTYRDPEIYRDMYLERYYCYVTDWHAYPQELVILRIVLPPQIRQYIPTPTPDMTMGHMVEYIMDAKVVAHAMQADAYVVELQVPVDDAGIGEPIFEVGPVFLEDPIPAVPLQKVPPEVEIEANDYDADDDMDAPEDQPEDPPIIDISSNDEDEDMEPEPESGDWVEDADDLDDDPEEILYDDGDWDTDSDASSVITI
ncbi:hypothetical protein TIFTF001_049461 [Ficus carica]|uniref:Uncharacterized protein n=1 Tax=Ficus carica TaxID=3494 RepID=A0AA87Z353_FICCA|nr:hypothetical protein TIFTF001_049461 [Ficus carica]